MRVNLGKYPKNSSSRKVNVTIDNFDTYNMDHTLALIILPLLIQLKNNKHGVPNTIVKDVGGEDYSEQASFDFYADTYTESFNKACERWDEILDKMIWSFQQLALEDYDNKYHHGKPDYNWLKIEDKTYNPVTNQLENTYELVDNNPDEHWYDSVGHQMHEERIQEGLELFGKYYRNLWD